MKKIYYFLTVFLTGLTITAVELTVSHLVAPYFGASLLVWTNVIGIILAGLALGYYIGGRIADKYPNPKYLYLIILLSGILFLIIPFLIKPFASFAITNPFTELTSSTATIFVASFFIIVLLFFPPVTLLATVSPYLIKLLNVNNKKIGQTSGKIFAIGTIGSIIGTFLPAFLFIPFLGSKETILFFGGLMIFLGILGIFKNKIKFLSSIIIILPLFSNNLFNIKNTQGTILETETPYQYIQVKEENQKKYLYFNEGTGPQTIHDPNSILTNSYYDYFTPLPYLLPNQKDLNVLILGLGAGSMTNQYQYFFKNKYNLNIDGVELDPKVTDIAKKYFNLKTQNLTIYNQDARFFLKTTDKKYDLILIDAYKQYYLPEHLVTTEFFNELKEKLNPNGLIASNFVTMTQNQLFYSVNNTISSVFNNLYYFQIPGLYNYLIISSNQELNFEKLKNVKNKKLAVILKYFQTIKKYQPTQDQIFTDNKTPISIMTDLMLIKELK
ncbi:MAG: fused MFS/spermidine synthase [Patescibacteria group bacterium]|nr:fused MFS/spermidine synthase [Patescibacteria group bacterium]